MTSLCLRPSRVPPGTRKRTKEDGHICNLRWTYSRAGVGNGSGVACMFSLLPVAFENN